MALTRYFLLLAAGTVTACVNVTDPSGRSFDEKKPDVTNHVCSVGEQEDTDFNRWRSDNDINGQHSYDGGTGGDIIVSVQNPFINTTPTDSADKKIAATGEEVVPSKHHLAGAQMAGGAKIINGSPITVDLSGPVKSIKAGFGDIGPNDIGKTITATFTATTGATISGAYTLSSPKSDGLSYVRLAPNFAFEKVVLSTPASTMPAIFDAGIIDCTQKESSDRDTDDYTPSVADDPEPDAPTVSF